MDDWIVAMGWGSCQPGSPYLGSLRKVQEEFTGLMLIVMSRSGNPEVICRHDQHVQRVEPLSYHYAKSLLWKRRGSTRLYVLIMPTDDFGGFPDLDITMSISPVNSSCTLRRLPRIRRPRLATAPAHSHDPSHP